MISLVLCFYVRRSASCFVAAHLWKKILYSITRLKPSHVSVNLSPLSFITSNPSCSNDFLISCIVTADFSVEVSHQYNDVSFCVPLNGGLRLILEVILYLIIRCSDECYLWLSSFRLSRRKPWRSESRVLPNQSVRSVLIWIEAVLPFACGVRFHFHNQSTAAILQWQVPAVRNQCILHR